jgi:hypothetical protein
MSHNKLSGSVVAPEYFGPKTGAPGTNILSGTFKGDGAVVNLICLKVSSSLPAGNGALNWGLF